MHDRIKKMSFVNKAALFVIVFSIGLIVQYGLTEYFQIPQFGEQYLYGYAIGAIFLFVISKDGFFSSWLSFVITNMVAVCILMFVHISYGKQIDHCRPRDMSKKCIDLRGWKTAPLTKQFQLIQRGDEKNEVNE